MLTKIEAKNKIKGLVEQFEKFEDTYIDSKYKEAELRLHFLDPFFTALGWELASNTLKDPRDIEVVIENSIDNEDSNTKKFVDYTFKINRKVQFLVEAKKPSESLSKKNHIFQAKSYAFTSEIPFVVLTNFKEFRFFDISTEPLFNQPETDEVKEYSFNYKKYIENFDVIWDLFSRDAVEKKSLAKFYANRRGLKYTSDQVFNLNYQVTKGESLLDASFLKNLKIWRKLLAEDILSNNAISIKAINEVVQRILDRLIFIRIVEDREIEREEYLKDLVEKCKIDSTLNLKRELDVLCNNLNEKFNGLIFHGHTQTLNTAISNDVLIKIIDNMYYPNSPYNFKLIKPEILGRIFEQFLGETIELKNGHIEIVLKELNKKAGGVYYTPSYIVENIVEKALSKKIDVNDPNLIQKIKSMRIADISCGSGTFLISVYKYIINLYQEYYSKCSQADLQMFKAQDLIFEDNNRILLTMEHKKEILLDNIFGVDIDAQAIEVAKLSLYITMLEEGYREDTVRPILPNLESNIQNGNSIISSDLYLEDDLEFDEDLIVPFDWSAAFPEIIDNGGFDIIVGNPPYIRLQIFEDVYGKGISNFVKNNYNTAAKRNFDIYVVFIEKALQLLNENGVLGYIVMNKFFTTKYGANLRELLSEQKVISEIVDFGTIEIFKGAITYTCILILDKNTSDKVKVQLVNDLENWQMGHENEYLVVSADEFTKAEWYLPNKTEEDIFENFAVSCITLKDIIEKYFVGVQTNGDDIYILNEVDRDEEFIYCQSKFTGKTHKFEKEHLRPLLKGSLDVRKYYFSNAKKWLLFPYVNEGNKSNLITQEDYAEYYPNTWAYLKECKDFLNERTKIKEAIEKDPNFADWYKYIYKKNHTLMTQQKLVFPAISQGSSFCFDTEASYFFVGSGAGGGGGGAITLLSDLDVYNYESLLGILNSDIVSFQIIKRGSKQKNNYFGVDKDIIQGIFIPKIDDQNIKDLNNISKLVKQLLKKYSELKEENITDNKKAQISKTISMLEIKINNLVYDLYKLPEHLIAYIKETVKF